MSNTTNLGVSVSPSGRLRLQVDPESSPPVASDWARELDAAFAESSAAGLFALGAARAPGALPPTLVFWRDFAGKLFEELRRLGDGLETHFDDLAPLSSAEREQLLEGAPPTRGLEYLTSAALGTLWLELHAAVVARAEAHADGPEAFLRGLNPTAHLVGRVTFHLAENKHDERRPFAFLATYTHRASASAVPRHLPLSEAVKQYAGARDQAQLTALLEPVRRAAANSPLARELLDTRALFAPQAWTVGRAYQFLCDVPRLRQAGVVARVPNWWRQRNPPRPTVQVRVGEKRRPDESADTLLDFQIDVALDGEPLTDAEREAILGADAGLVLLRGKWVEVDSSRLREVLEKWQELRAEHAAGLSFHEGLRLLAGAAPDGKDVLDAPTQAWSEVVAGAGLRQTLERLRDPKQIDQCQPGRDLRATLRPYQAEGVRWLWFMTRLGLGACLADDMGLGKTIQIIDLLLHLKREAGGGSPSLLVVPASLVGNWRQEFEKFAPQLRVLYAHRSECSAETLSALASDPAAALAGCDAVVTTYTLARSADWPALVDWRLVALDEAQAIKNAGSSQTKAVKKLRTKARVALTGTPVENHLGDLWSLFDFCNPGLLGSVGQFKQFTKRLNARQDAAGFAALRKLTRPYILRRVKTDPHVAPDLPDKTEMRVDCGLAKRQAVLYERAVRELAERLKTAEGISRRGMVLGALVQLKQICNHPSQYLGDGTYDAADSGKFRRLAQICETLLERQERLLVFTQFQTLCQPLADHLAGLFGRAGLVLHGQTPVAQRKRLVAAFQDPEGPPFFVISLKAGGSGLNLTAASHVVHFDRWWNPAVENQATDRAFRIGQTKNVLVHKFVCRGTLEERVDRVLREKQQLADQLLGQEAETLLTELSDDELLRFVAIDVDRALAVE